MKLAKAVYGCLLFHQNMKRERDNVSERERESSSLNHIRVLISFVKADGEGHSAMGEKRQGLINRDI